MKAASTLDFRELVRRRLPRFLFDAIDCDILVRNTIESFWGNR